MTVLVTGGSGFLGRSLCAALAARGFEVRATFRSMRSRDPELSNIDWHAIDLGRLVDWAALLDGVTVLYHLAWTTIPASAAADPAADVSHNLGGLVGLLEAVRQFPGLRIVFPSSGGTIYGCPDRLPVAEDHPKQPISAYGATKLAAESFLDLYRFAHGVNSIVLRIANPYGIGQNPAKGLGVVTTFARAAVAERPITVFGTGRTVRDFVHVDDVVAAFLHAGDRPDVQGPVNIGSGRGVSLAQLITDLEQLFGRSLAVVQKPARPFDVPACILDIARAEQRLGWTPQVTWTAGLTRLFHELSKSGR